MKLQLSKILPDLGLKLRFLLNSLMKAGTAGLGDSSSSGDLSASLSADSGAEVIAYTKKMNCL